MKSLKFIVLSICLFLVSCSKENKDPDPVVKSDDEKTAHYQIKLTLETDSFDNPDERETNTFTFEYKDGKFTENARKVSAVSVNRIRHTSIVDAPVDVVSQADLEITDLSQLAATIPSISVGVNSTPGVVTLRGIDNQPFADPGNIQFIRHPTDAFVSNQTILLHTRLETIEVLKSVHDVNIEIKQDNNIISNIVIPIEINSELATFDLLVDRQATQNQSSETIPHMGINNANWPELTHNYKHVVGGDGCPMPLWNLSLQLTNNVSAKMKSKFAYGITGLEGIDAVDLHYPDAPDPRIVNLNGTDFQFFPPNQDGIFQSNFVFNCARAQDVNAQNANLTVLFTDGFEDHPVLNGPLPFNIDMQ